MTKLPSSHPYRKHSENLRSVVAGVTQAELVHKAAIRRGNDAAVEYASRIHHFMVGLMAEASLRKIIADPDGFNAKEKALLQKERSQLDRWLRVVEFAFRRHYAVPLHLDLVGATVGPVAARQYSTLVSLLKNDLTEVIDDRNNIAHGQWSWLLNNKETAFLGRGHQPLNYRAIEHRGKIITLLAGLVTDLAVSEPTFQRDFAARYARIVELRGDLVGRSYPALVAELRSRRRPA